MCLGILNSILTYLILLKISITKRCYKKNGTKTKLIEEIKLLSFNNDIEVIKNDDKINIILENGWYSIKKYNNNIRLVDISFNYNDSNYNILFKYPENFLFPLKFESVDFDNKILSITDSNDIELDSCFKKYLGPESDFYIHNKIHFSIKDIAIMNGIKIPQYLIITFYNLDNYRVDINDNIIDIIKHKKK